MKGGQSIASAISSMLDNNFSRKLIRAVESHRVGDTERAVAAVGGWRAFVVHYWQHTPILLSQANAENECGPDFT